MWFDNVTIEADTTEDQSGVSHNKVRYAIVFLVVKCSILWFIHQQAVGLLCDHILLWKYIV